MRRILLAPLLLVALIVPTTPAGAITYGEIDGTNHPNVGALVREVDGEKDWFCSGALVSSTVFLTAGHCTESAARRGLATLFVTFDPVFDADGGTFYEGDYYTHPNYNPNTLENDVGVVVLRSPVGIAPVQLPTANLLGQMKRAGTLKFATITNVGYGGTATFKGHPPLLEFDGVRRFSTSPVVGLKKFSLVLLMNNDATGGGGTCFGDSGGPHFLGTSNLLVSVTSWGDAWCRALDQTHRADTASVRAFLASHGVSLP